MAFPAHLLLPLLLPAERLINVALDVDELSRARLGELNDKVIVIHETRFDAYIGVSVVANKIQLLNQFDGYADVTLTGDYQSLLELVQFPDALYGSSIRIEGELGLAEKLKTIIRQLDVDIESMLAPITGGTAAHQAARLVQSVSSWFARVQDSVETNTKDYLQEESNILVPETLAKEFTASVTEVREGVDRAEARLRWLEQRFAKARGNHDIRSVSKSDD